MRDTRVQRRDTTLISRFPPSPSTLTVVVDRAAVAAGQHFCPRENLWETAVGTAGGYSPRRLFYLPLSETPTAKCAHIVSALPTSTPEADHFD